MIAFIAFTTSCETDTVEQGNQALQAKSGEFDAESTYYSILGNTESGMAQFDALTNFQKQAVWVFKYTRFKNDNTLTALQEEAVDELFSYVNDVDFSDGDETLESNLESNVRDRFNEEQSDFLLFTLENDTEDIALKSCFWCYQEIPGTRSACSPVIVDGEYTGDFTFTTRVSVRRFWIGFGEDDATLPCSFEDWYYGW